MKLNALVKDIAWMLGNTWRFEIRSGTDDRPGAPVLTNRKFGWLVFDDTDENHLLVTLMRWDGGTAWCQMPYGLGIGETAQRIRNQVIYRDAQPVTDAEERRVWHDGWCALFSAWAQEQGLAVEFTVDAHDDLIHTVRADFGETAKIQDDHFVGARAKAWGSITVAYDAFPVRIERYTSKAALIERLGVIEQRVAAYTPKHGIESRSRAA